MSEMAQRREAMREEGKRRAMGGRRREREADVRRRTVEKAICERRWMSERKP